MGEGRTRGWEDVGRGLDLKKMELCVPTQTNIVVKTVV
jgi:hypothetical protein